MSYRHGIDESSPTNQYIQVLNQGGRGTCATYALALVISSSLWEKYRLCCDGNIIATVIRANCPHYNGASLQELCDKWNAACRKDGAFIPDMASKNVMNVELKKITDVEDFDQVFDEMLKREQTRTMILCSIKSPSNPTSEKGHAVALHKCLYKDGKKYMLARNIRNIETIMKLLHPRIFTFNCLRK